MLDCIRLCMDWIGDIQYLMHAEAGAGAEVEAEVETDKVHSVNDFDYCHRLVFMSGHSVCQI